MSTGHADELKVECERKRSVKDHSKNLSNWRMETGKTEKRGVLGQELGNQTIILEKLGLRCMLDINGTCHLKS